MKKIWKYLKHHLQEDFNVKEYFAIAVLLTVLIAINYTVDFEDSYLDSLSGFTKFFNYFLLYAFAFYASTALYVYFQKRGDLFSKKEFWIKSLFGLLLLSLDSSVPFLHSVIQLISTNQTYIWAFKVTVNMISFLTVFLPVILFYAYVEKKDGDIYGLKPRQFDVKPYVVMLLIMLPGMIAASFTKSFLRQYPMYKSTSAHEYLQIDEWVTAGIYELAYGLDFITVELLFRGFFVIAMTYTMGRGAVITMAVIYCTLHFGKPMGEAISSIFGGFILGVIAYETRSIWGGVIVHVGIAWLMELIAFIQKS